jgi:hypothetical protein
VKLVEVVQLELYRNFGSTVDLDVLILIEEIEKFCELLEKGF